MIKILSYILFPLTIWYSIIVWIRNKFYDYEVLQAQKHKVLIIGVGNLKAGGEGKTPCVEYLISILKDKYKIAVLSRGYHRKTKDFRFVETSSLAIESGDEPLQIKQKFPDITVCVCSNKNKGISLLEQEIEGLQIVILDDSFQDREIAQDITILLTQYAKPFFMDKIIPYGLLREKRNGYKRADFIIVTKVPQRFSIGERGFFESELKPKKYQHVFYSSISYRDIYPLFEESNTSLVANKVILLTCIANNDSIKEYIKENTDLVQTIEFADHHNFSRKDINFILSTYKKYEKENTIIVTTQKDAMRLKDWTQLQQTRLFVLPIETIIHDNTTNSFNRILIEKINNERD